MTTIASPTSKSVLSKKQGDPKVMKNQFSRRSFVLTSAAAAGALALPHRRVLAADPFKIGFIYVGPIGDYGWTHGHDEARRQMEEKLGGKVKTTYVESVAEGPDAERVIRQLATTGHQLIFTTSFGFMDATVNIAQQFPDVKFEHATGFQTAPNLAIYNARFYEGRAIAGTIAGHLTKSGILGYVGSFPIPEVVMGINALTLAAQKIRPDIKTKVKWVNSWYDPGKEADAAKALIDQGVDVMSQHTDSPAPLQAAEERNIIGFGQASDMKTYAPKAQLTSLLDKWGGYYTQRAEALVAGTWQTGSVWWGLKEGMVQMAEYGPAVTENVRKAADAVRDDIIAGKLHPFTGPIKDQSGKERVAAGQIIPDEELLKIDWYVEGVEA
jgi:basic membrane protein A and related proteins